jgi:hypothetical protein
VIATLLGYLWMTAQVAAVGFFAGFSVGAGMASWNTLHIWWADRG